MRIKCITRGSAVVAVSCAWALGAGLAIDAGGDSKRELRFAADMAKAGNWREAQYRWKALSAEAPDNSRIHNNLAVAAEALGDPDSAREHYRRARELVPSDTRIENNYARFERFCRMAHAGDDGPADGELPAAPDPKRDKKASGKGKPLKVTVSLPLPPRMDLDGASTVLVASFLSTDSAFLDLDRELVRFLRGKLQKSPLEVLPVTPAPAVPEQTLEDLIANAEFWRHLGREQEVDLIVSGKVTYGRRDVSGFREVDRISQTTGQKVRSTEFVEEEQFSYAIDLIFMDGSDGSLRFRDRLQRSAVYRGSQNDPISAFFQMNESLTPDLLAIVAPRRSEDPRIIFVN